MYTPCAASDVEFPIQSPPFAPSLSVTAMPPAVQIMANYLFNSTVGTLPLHSGLHVFSERFFSFRRGAVLSARLTIPTSSLL